MKSRLINVSNVAGVLFVILVMYSILSLSQPLGDSDKLDNYMPAKWRIISPSFQPPQIEITLFKDHVSEDEETMNTLKYTFSNNNVDNNDKMLGIVAEVIPNRNTVNELEKEKKKIGLRPKTIIQIPKFGCPTGYKKDYMGNCREVYNMG